MDEKRRRGGSGLIDDDVRATSIGILVILGVGLTAQFYLAGNLTQPYSEIAVLGSTGQFDSYPPSAMEVGSNYTLNLYVANHEGHSMMYAVYEKIGTPTSVINQTTPLLVSPVDTYWFVLPNNGTSIEPITVQLQAAGTNIRLVWELWYLTPSDSWTYGGAWAQLIVNGT